MPYRDFARRVPAACALVPFVDARRSSRRRRTATTAAFQALMIFALRGCVGTGRALARRPGASATVRIVRVGRRVLARDRAARAVPDDALRPVRRSLADAGPRWPPSCGGAASSAPSPSASSIATKIYPAAFLPLLVALGGQESGGRRAQRSAFGRCSRSVTPRSSFFPSRPVAGRRRPEPPAPGSDRPLQIESLGSSAARAPPRGRDAPRLASGSGSQNLTGTVGTVASRGDHPRLRSRLSSSSGRGLRGDAATDSVRPLRRGCGSRRLRRARQGALTAVPVWLLPAVVSGRRRTGLAATALVCRRVRLLTRGWFPDLLLEARVRFRPAASWLVLA